MLRNLKALVYGHEAKHLESPHRFPSCHFCQQYSHQFEKLISVFILFYFACIVRPPIN